MTWPETEIGQVASVPCPCGVSDPLIQLLRGTRRCGGTYDTGAVWEDPQCDFCQFSSTRLTLCSLAEVGSLKGIDLWLYVSTGLAYATTLTVARVGVASIIVNAAMAKHILWVYLQVDSPALLANELVNMTDTSEGIESEDVSLTVVLLDTVTNSTEDLQQKDVSGDSDTNLWTQYTCYCSMTLGLFLSCNAI